MFWTLYSESDQILNLRLSEWDMYICIYLYPHLPRGARETIGFCPLEINDSGVLKTVSNSILQTNLGETWNN